MPYTVLADRETRLVNDKGEITRAKCDWKFSGGWKVVALVRRNNFGHVVEWVPFKDWAARLPEISEAGWHYKNGKSKWTMCDWDHGSHREWGCGVERVYRSNID